MTRDVVEIKMPFRKGIFFREKEVPFLFKIMTLEIACDDLGKDFGELFSEGTTDVQLYAALVWAGYIAACREAYRKPRHTRKQADFWAEFMSASSRALFMEEVKAMMGRLKESGDKSGVKKK